MRRAHLFIGFTFAGLAILGQPAVVAAQLAVDTAMTRRLIDEGMQRSEALELFYTLTDVYGPRLTGSPEYDRAAEWARDRFAAWGLADPRLEPFEFGRGWTLDALTAEMTSPRYMPLIAYAEAWTPSTAGVVSGRAVYIGDETVDEIRGMSAALRGAIVLTHQPQRLFRDEDRPQPGLSDDTVRTGNPPGIPVESAISRRELGPFLREVGAAVALRPSHYRDGTVGVLGNRSTPDDAVPSLIVSAEQYNMIVRLAARDVAVELRLEVQTRFDDETRTYNVLADIPGTDPEVADEVVLVGAHLDSWHTASGATDNGDGVLAVMEAARLLSTLDAQPRRTIRFARWSGEEQGLLGARAYIDQRLADEAARSKLAVYLNDDPGSGRSLGFYMPDNDEARALFDAWLQPLSAFGVTRKLKQQAVFLAHFAWQAAQFDGRIPGG